MKNIFQKIGIEYKTYVTSINQTGVRVMNE